MMNILRRFWKEEEGQGMVEYALIIVAIALVVLVGLRALGIRLDTLFDTITF